MKCILIAKNPSIEKAPEIISNFLKDKIGRYAVEYIKPEKEKNKVKEEYTISQIKKISEKFSLKSFDPNLEKLVVISNAEKISPISQNAFLKTLEESTSSIILIVDNIESLLPTVRSRCEVYDTQTNGEENTSESNLTEITFDTISSLSKLDRESLKDLLKSKSKEITDYNKLLKYDEAIKQLNANCKTESVLIELLR